MYQNPKFMNQIFETKESTTNTKLKEEKVRALEKEKKY
jgi:hypothetical protein